MRRAYPTSFCFQEVIEIILGVFFTASVSKGAGFPAVFSPNGIVSVSCARGIMRATKIRTLHKKREECGARIL
jgi:hypothetical protein